MSNAALMKHWRYKQAAVGITCALCGEPISVGGDKDKGALTADHILPKSLGGTWAKQNLQPAHLICNRKRQNMLMHEFKRAVDAEARVRRAIEIIEAHEQATEPRLTLSQRLMSAVRRLRRGQNASGEYIHGDSN